MKEIPYIGFGNETLEKLKDVEEGDMITCPRCGKQHVLKAGTDEKGNKTDVILFYECGNEVYLGAINGKLVAGIKPDVKGGIECG